MIFINIFTQCSVVLLLFIDTSNKWRNIKQYVYLARKMHFDISDWILRLIRHVFCNNSNWYQMNWYGDTRGGVSFVTVLYTKAVGVFVDM